VNICILIGIKTSLSLLQKICRKGLKHYAIARENCRRFAWKIEKHPKSIKYAAVTAHRFAVGNNLHLVDLLIVLMISCKDHGI
jgi:hypothetical protein